MIVAGILLLLVVALTVGGVIRMFCRVSSYQADQRAAQFAFDNAIERKEKVKALSKTFKTSEISENSYIGNDTYTTDTYHMNTHYIAFEFPDKSRKVFEVDADRYVSVTEGETGVLTYKEYDGKLFFLDFQWQ